MYAKVIVISDEIYERLTYDVPHTSFASLPEMFDRVITINGFSKSHSMTGYRIGYSASNTVIAKANSKIQSQMTSCASSISQYAATMALTKVPETWMNERVTELKSKRDFAYALLQKIPNVSCPKPDGAFYLLPDISYYYNRVTKTGKRVTNSHELCLELLRDEGVRIDTKYRI
jgi:aspartate/methionine/tyrosine aminotransferase